MLLMGQMEEILMSRDTTIFPLQHLQSILNPVQDSNSSSWYDSKFCENDTFIATTKNKVDSGSMPRPVCERFCHMVLELTKMIGLLASTIPAVLPTQLNFRYFQQQQINA